MTENENMVVTEVTPPEADQPTKGQKFKAGLKEWFRKQLVNLKRRTNNIPLFFLLVSGLIYIFTLGSFSQSVMSRLDADWCGIATFVCTLLSILALVTYMNAYPKRKKTNIPMLVLTFVFIALMIFMDVMFYIDLERATADAILMRYDYWDTTFNVLIVHIVFLGITAILMATLPLYKAALMKVNTRKDVETTEMKEVIDTADMD